MDKTSDAGETPQKKYNRHCLIHQLCRVCGRPLDSESRVRCRRCLERDRRRYPGQWTPGARGRVPHGRRSRVVLHHLGQAVKHMEKMKCLEKDENLNRIRQKLARLRRLIRRRVSTKPLP